MFQDIPIYPACVKFMEGFSNNLPYLDKLSEEKTMLENYFIATYELKSDSYKYTIHRMFGVEDGVEFNVNFSIGRIFTNGLFMANIHYKTKLYTNNFGVELDIRNPKACITTSERNNMWYTFFSDLTMSLKTKLC